jgi:GNAT superfamily N-acetyltransferase
LSSNTHHHVTVDGAEGVAAEADVHADHDNGLVQADLHVEPGHQRPGIRTDLVDAVLDSAEPGSHLLATLPAGDAEILTRLRERCTDVETRSAGATVLAEGTLADQQ